MSLFDKFKKWLSGRDAANDATDEPDGDRDGSPVPEPARPTPARPRREGKKPPPAAVAEPRPRHEVRERARRQRDATLEVEARALFERGDASGGVALLTERGILFARHQASALPCLCRRCLRPEVHEAEHRGVRYLRDFVVSQYRVLFYWMPAELDGDEKQVRASMRSELRERLRVLRTKEEETRETINPFTREKMTIAPKERRRAKINPFTGKPIR